ncbi:hypothetical protein ThidrDRAFT_4481 [Thiorhodococcus drewsii AZ1]|uniref:Uncharacterized protein n=1 Tax=Thiorhodococcus drewsii AZ1 TaxID=765913 RepID=G2E867_9GAMM|nr:hypothetical protein [Thiorhodococcus drewsii]EGV27703.1 hypothetical protein ThidrDRAFT_4481 [Thiorhodococcus drewsii AZ1]
MKTIQILALTTGMIVSPLGQADHLLFPFVVSNPDNVVTLISITNMASTYGYLRYRYFYKSATNNDECQEYEFIRSTYPGDIVTFDVSGTLGDGAPVNNDPDSYEGRFSLPSMTRAVRGYLLVNHYDKDTKTATKEGATTLMGQATVIEIQSGSAWGYQAFNDTKADEKPDFSKSGGVISTDKSVPFTFQPSASNQWTTKFFVTPVGSDMTGASSQYSSHLKFTINNQNSANMASDITCTGAIDFADVMSAATLQNVEETGGWGTLTLDKATGYSPAIIFKLDYTYSEDILQSGSANNGILLGN